MSYQDVDLQSLLYRLEAQIRSLNELGMTKGRDTAFLYPLVEAALPEELLNL